MNPAVTVLMTTFNGQDTIRQSIDSILAQGFEDFELVIVDDGSTDGTAAILSQVDDPRVRVLASEGNHGIVAARNRGFAAARGRYVAALDHDDLSHPDRLARQVAFLGANPGVVLVATEICIAENGRVRAPDHPRVGDPASLRWLMMIDNPLTWSSVMFRADAVRGLGEFLRPEYALADDFDLYHRLLHVGDIARIDDALTTYRYHGGNASLARASELRAKSEKVLSAAYAEWLGGEAQGAAALVTRHLCEREPASGPDALDQLGRVLERLLAGFCRTHARGAEEQQRVAVLAGEAWWRAVRAPVRSGLPGLLRHYYARKPLAAHFRPQPADVMVSLAVGAIRGLGR